MVASDANRRTIDPDLCPGHDTYLATIRKANDTLEVREWCRHCTYWNGGWSFARLQQEHGVTPDQLPIERDYLDDADPCAVRGCRNPGAEYHHWAPQSIFEDADMWPISPLCQQHHRNWHDLTGIAIGGAR